MKPELVIIGGGLAGSEAAWQAAVRGVRGLLYEMRPGGVTEAIASHPNIKIIREEVIEPSFEVPVIVATGPHTSDRLIAGLQRIIQEDLIYFYDALSPWN